MINGLPQRLQEMRIKFGLSQRAVAKQLEISPSVVSAYETGERTPSTEILLALSYLYKCSTDYLLGKDRNTPEVTISTEGLNSEQIQAIISLIKTMKA
ncbi:MAG: helix-turn-helix transcriptional regulator [Oscillospiraceae bacterium]|nr:helix-turn-helix transcriptional regulator [Oscillospiraceae bacterium]